MHTFHMMDVAKTTYQKKEIYVQIESVSGKTASAWPLNLADRYQPMDFPVAKLTYVPPVKVTEKQLKDFCRGELTLKQMKNGNEYLNVETKKPYHITLDDLFALVKKLAGLKDDGETFFDWFTAVNEEIWDMVSVDDAMLEPDGYDDDGLPADHKVFENAWNDLCDIYSGDTDAEIKDVADYIQTYYDNQKKALAKRKFTDDEELAYIMMWDRLGTIEKQNKEMKETWRRAVEDLCAKKNPEALEIKAYACYGGGNGVYHQDYETSRSCLLEVLKMQADPFAANTLGYIYYYGRCNDGRPEYAKAFKYFSIGAAAGVVESEYKLADMFLNGYGVGKNPSTAARIIWKLYDECLERFCKGEPANKFADVALRAGSLMKDGVDCFPDYDEAYALYLQARYTLQQRMETDDFYGDPIVMNHIEDAIDEIASKTEFQKGMSTVHYDSPFALLRSCLDGRNLIEMKIKNLTNNRKQLTFRIKGNQTSENVPQFLVTVPEGSYCRLKDKITVTVKDITEFEVPADTDTVLFNEVSDTDFYFFGDPVASIAGDYTYRIPKDQELILYE